MNRHERRKAKVMTAELTTITPEMAKELLKRGQACCFDGCKNGFKGEKPPGWQTILMFTDRNPVVSIMDIEEWTRDGMLCPEHAATVQNLLFPLQLLELAAMPTEGDA
jgi:hypothetical protein